MTRLVISLDGEVVREVELTQPRTTVGRRAGNGIVIDQLGVSGTHAALVQSPEGLRIEDLQSTNGTYVNDRAVGQEWLRPGDVIGIGRCRLLVTDEQGAAPPGTSDRLQGPVTLPAAPPGPHTRRGPPGATQTALVRVLDGPAAGREVLLTKARTTLGKPGVLVVAIARQGGDHLLERVEGTGPASVNGAALPAEGLRLHDGDLIDLVGTRLAFSCN